MKQVFLLSTKLLQLRSTSVGVDCIRVLGVWLWSVFFHNSFICSESFLNSTIVCDIFSLCSNAIDIKSLPINLNRVVAVLIYDALCLLQIFLLGFGFPPVNQVAISILLTSLVIKSMGYLMPNNKPDGSIVHIQWSVSIEEDTIENSCGELDGVFISIVEGIYNCSSSVCLPTLLIDWFPEFFDIVKRDEFL